MDLRCVAQGAGGVVLVDRPFRKRLGIQLLPTPCSITPRQPVPVPRHHDCATCRELVERWLVINHPPQQDPPVQQIGLFEETQ